MLGVDVGGTFTDVVRVDGARVTVAKVATDPTETERSVLLGSERLGVRGAAAFNHASTAGLNAIITRRLPKIGFLGTIGHRDLLDFGRAWRPPEALTDPDWRRPFGDAAAPLVPRYLRRGVKERLRADGSVFLELDEDQARGQLDVLKRCAVEGVAICLLNAYVNPDHEGRLRELVAEVLGDVECSVSSDVSPLAKEYARASTTVVDVLMKLIYEEYSARLLAGLRERGFEGQLNFADCAASLLPVEAAMEEPFRVVFAGPAAGTVSSAYFGGLVGDRNLLCCDVGGTSCDISVVAGGRPAVNTTFELEHDLLVNSLATDIATFGAGGGSIVSITSRGELAVGPGSAGASPGPACYGRGGSRPTVTDACLLMGIIDPQGFAGGELPLQPALAEEAFAELDTPIPLDLRVPYAFEMALNNIAEGLVDVTVKRGVDPRDYTLMAYGAAGPMLLPSLLERVGAREILVPPHPGLFSALGLLSSNLVYADSRSAYVLLQPGAAEQISAVYREMEARLLSRVGAERDEASVCRTFDGRLFGQTWETPLVDVPDGELDEGAVAEMIEEFHRRYERLWGNRFDPIPVQGVTYRVEVVIPTSKVEYEPIARNRDGRSPAPTGEVELRFVDESEARAAEYTRESLHAGDLVPGPALIREDLATTYIRGGQSARVGSFGELRITTATG